MKPSFQNVDAFQKELGNLTIHFSKLEFALIYYCSIIEQPDNYQIKMPNYLGMELNKKRNVIKDFIYANLPELKKDWDGINSKIGNINEDRRHLIHGIGKSYFLLDTINTIIKKGDKIISKEYTVNDIMQITDKIAHILTGDNGIEGEFLIKFTTHLFNYHNNKTSVLKKIVYRVNGNILTNWKG